MRHRVRLAALAMSWLLLVSPASPSQGSALGASSAGSVHALSIGVASAPSSAPFEPVTITPQTTDPRAGRRVTITGQGPRQSAGDVVKIQKRRPGTGRWKTAVSTKTTRSGGFKAKAAFSAGAWELRARVRAGGLTRVSQPVLITALGTKVRAKRGSKTRVLSAASVASATTGPDGRQVVVVSGAARPKIGKILTAAPSATAPEGVFGKVVAIDSLTGAATLAPVPLEKAYPKLQLSTVLDIPTVQQLSASSTVRAQELQCRGSVQLNSTLQLTETRAAVDIDLGRRYVSVIIRSVPRVGITIAGGVAGGATCTIGLPKAIVPLPVPGLTLGVTPEGSFSVNLAGGCSAETSASSRIRVGFSKSGSNPPVRYNDADLETKAQTSPECGTGVNMTADAKMAIDLSAGGTVGVYGDAGPELTGLISSGNRGLCVDWDAALAAGFGVKADFLFVKWKWELAELRSVLASKSVCGVQPPSTVGPPTPSPPASAAGLIPLINQLRSQPRWCGTDFFQATGPLTAHDALNTAAQSHVQDMVARRYFSHVTPEGLYPFDRAWAAGWRLGSVSEVLTQTNSSEPAAAVQSWAASPPHCSCLMNPNADYVGVGVAQGDLWTWAAKVGYIEGPGGPCGSA